MADSNAAGGTSGLTDNAAGAIAYFTFIPAVLFLVTEPYNKSSYVRFHAWQSILLFFGAFGVFVDHDLVFERKLVGVDSLIAGMADPTDIGWPMIMVAMAGDHKQ